MELSITEVEKFKIIKPSGRIDWENARELDQECYRIIEAECYDIVFNLDEVTFICSGGIGVIAFNLTKVKRKGGSVYIISSNKYINGLFETLRFNIVFEGFYFKTYQEFAAVALKGENNKA
jgi:anti-anti-sigma factor